MFPSWSLNDVFWSLIPFGIELFELINVSYVPSYKTPSSVFVMFAYICSNNTMLFPLPLETISSSSKYAKYGLTYAFKIPTWPGIKLSYAISFRLTSVMVFPFSSTLEVVSAFG